MYVYERKRESKSAPQEARSHENTKMQKIAHDKKYVFAPKNAGHVVGSFGYIGYGLHMIMM
jgi:hypothetical protein